MALPKSLTSERNPVYGNIFLIILYGLLAIDEWRLSSADAAISRNLFLPLAVGVLIVWIVVGFITAKRSQNPWYVAFIIGNQMKARDERDLTILSQAGSITLCGAVLLALGTFILLIAYPPTFSVGAFYVLPIYVVLVRIVYQISAGLLGLKADREHI